MKNLRHFRAFDPAAALAAALLLSGCMLTGSSDPVTVIAPELTPTVEARGDAVDWSVRVVRPEADRTRSSDRILVRVEGSRLQPYPAVVWLDDVPEMLQGLMIQGLEDSGRLAGVFRSGGPSGRFTLAGEIRRFEAVDDGRGRLTAELDVRARLIDHAGGHVVASERFVQRTVASERGLGALVVAFEEGLSALVGEITEWLIREGESSLADS